MRRRRGRRITGRDEVRRDSRWVGEFRRDQRSLVLGTPGLGVIAIKGHVVWETRVAGLALAVKAVVWRLSHVNASRDGVG